MQTRQQNSTSALSVSPLRAFQEHSDLYVPGAQTRSKQLFKENNDKNLGSNNIRSLGHQSSSVSYQMRERTESRHQYQYQQQPRNSEFHKQHNQSNWQQNTFSHSPEKQILSSQFTNQRTVRNTTSITDVTKNNQYAALAKNKNNCRSIGRIGKLIMSSNQTGQIAKEDQQKINSLKNNSQENSTSCKKMTNSLDKSQCSSATTAFTMANFQPRTRAARQHVQDISQTQKPQSRQQKMITRQQTTIQNKLVGKKRSSQQPTDQLEAEARLSIPVCKTQSTKHSQNIQSASRNTGGDICSPGSIMDIDIQEQSATKNIQTSYYSQVQTCKNQNKFAESPRKSAEVQYFTQNSRCNKQRRSGRGGQGSNHNDQQVGHQRQPRSKSHNMVRDQHSQPQNKERRLYSIIKLLNKKTGMRKNYKLYDEDDLHFLKATSYVPEMTEDGRYRMVQKYILDFNMKKLELEYDYDTDDEQLIAAKEMLMEDNFEAIQYCVHKDPLDLVGNLNSELSQDY